MRAELPESPVSLDDYGKMSMAERRELWLKISDISEAEFDAHMAREKAREADVPRPGATAPDFTAERLDATGKRTGETVRLSDHRGRPVALAFGSYT